MITVYVDGSCKGNPGPGGFGVIVIEDNKIINAHYEQESITTNNRMEMKAIIWALENYGSQIIKEGTPLEIPVVYSDSAYCVNSFTNWIHGWKANGWTRAKGKKLENLDLIQRYDELTSMGYAIDLRKIAGHAGNVWNELADKLATGKLTTEQAIEEYDIK